VTFKVLNIVVWLEWDEEHFDGCSDDKDGKFFEAELIHRVITSTLNYINNT